MPGTACARGFTLIELLLAMAISAFVAVVGYQGLRVAIDAADSVEREARLLADIELALGILESDISQAVARPVRNEFGSLDPIMVGGLANDSLLTFTRDHWRNPRNLRRSELARINYRRDAGELVRQRWLVLDRVSQEEGLEEAVLLDNVEEFQVEYFTPYVAGESDAPGVIEDSGGLAGQWVQWWSSERVGLDYAEPLPPAVRITLRVSGFGSFTRIISLASI